MLDTAKTLFNLATEQEWFDILVRSVYEPVIAGIDMPRFPHRLTQERWVGSADESALKEAFNFFTYVKGYADALGNPWRAGSNFLDFGCGWGRYGRLFWYDVAEVGLKGVDIDQEILATCKTLGV